MSQSLTIMLPDDFAHLQPFAGWILATERERNAKRLSSSLDDIRVFYDVMHRDVLRIQAALAPFKIADLPEPERNLMLLMMSLMEVSACIELFSSVEVPFAVAADRLDILQ